MADGMSSDMKSIAALLLSLFVVGIITGVSFIGFDELKSSICTAQDQGVTTWFNGICYNDTTKVTALTVNAIQKVTIVELVLDVVLGLLSLVVIMLIFKIVIKVAVGFGKGGF